MALESRPRRHHQVREPGDAPSIEMAEALADAIAYAALHAISLEHQYLQGAVFDTGTRLWVFDWQVPKGGMTIITVHESGFITVTD